MEPQLKSLKLHRFFLSIWFWRRQVQTRFFGLWAYAQINRSNRIKQTRSYTSLDAKSKQRRGNFRYDNFRIFSSSGLIEKQKKNPRFPREPKIIGGCCQILKASKKLIPWSAEVGTSPKLEWNVLKLERRRSWNITEVGDRRRRSIVGEFFLQSWSISWIVPKVG